MKDFATKKGFLQGSVNYHMNDVLSRQRRGRNVTSETKINLSQHNVLGKKMSSARLLPI